jgi:hypothetical protein
MARKPAATPVAQSGITFVSEVELRRARYGTTESELDVFGRLIGVRRMKPSEVAHFNSMTQDLSGYDEVEDEEGKPVKILHRMPLFLAASVREITDHEGNKVQVPFPRNRAELDAIFDRLDQEGISAATAAFGRLPGVSLDGDQVEAAKN